MEDYFVAYNIRETYHELGTYEVKIVLNPRHFKNSHLSEVVILDSDGKPVKQDIKKWGRKINCVFTIDKDVSDGVAVVKIQLLTTKETKLNKQLTFWVIK